MSTAAIAGAVALALVIGVIGALAAGPPGRSWDDGAGGSRGATGAERDVSSTRLPR